MPPVEQIKAKRAGSGYAPAITTAPGRALLCSLRKVAEARFISSTLRARLFTHGRCLILPATTAISLKEARSFITAKRSKIRRASSVDNRGAEEITRAKGR
jgi:hypothetical protein